MIGGRYDVRLNGISLNDFGEDVIITDIVEDEPSEVETVQSMAYAVAPRAGAGTEVVLSFSSFSIKASRLARKGRDLSY